MLTLATKLKNLAFVIVGLAVVAYVGIKYAALGPDFGLRDYYVVNVHLPQTGGLLSNADVTYRGVSVGRVGPIRLAPDGSEVVAPLRIKKSAPKIPSDAQAVVADLSAVGEVYVDLRPSTTSGPYLADGASIQQPDTQLPPPVTDVLSKLNNFAASVPLDSLRTVVNEFGQAFNGEGSNLQVLLDTSSKFIQGASADTTPTTKLIVDSSTVLKTQNDEAAALTKFADNAKLLAKQLRDDDPSLRKLIATTPGAASQVSGLLHDTDPGLSVTLANLLTTSDLTITRQNGLQELLVKLPSAINAGSSVIKNGKLQLGMVTTFFNPLPCTSGYGGTKYRPGDDTTSAGLNTAARCAMPASSGVDVRGAANAPHGGVPTPARAGALAVASSSALPGALGLAALPSASPSSAQSSDMATLLGLG